MTTLPNNIKKLLESRYGLDYTVLGKAFFQSIVEHAIIRLKLGSKEEYFRLLEKNAKELDYFANSLLVPETWFFREKVPLEYMIERLRSKLIDPYPIRI